MSNFITPAPAIAKQQLKTLRKRYYNSRKSETHLSLQFHHTALIHDCYEQFYRTLGPNTQAWHPHFIKHLQTLSTIRHEPYSSYHVHLLTLQFHLFRSYIQGQYTTQN